MANAGRVAIVPKGDYSSSTAYKRLDLVRYNEKAYVAKKANTGVAPTNTEYWMLMTSDGITIDAALSATSTNPVQNKVVKTAIDNIQTASRATLSQAGWYRVAEFKHTTSLFQFNIALIKGFGRYQPETHDIDVVANVIYGKADISSVDTCGNTQTLTKFRIAKDSSKWYADVYFDRAGDELLYVTVTARANELGAWQAITPTLTSETVDGVTVTTTYDIPANATPTTSVDLANYFPKSGGQLDGSLIAYSNEAVDRHLRVRNSNRTVEMVAKADGLFRMFDYTNNKDIINSTKDGTNTFNGTATNAEALGGKGASEYALVSSLSDLTPNRAHLSSEGWYRVAEISNTTIGYFSCILSLTQVYSSSNPQTTQLSIVRSSGDNGAVSITQLNGIMRSPSSVSKVRVVPGSGGKSAYIEIYYSNNTSNYVSVQITNILTDNLYGKYSNVAFTAGSIPSGYTATEFTLSSKPFKGDLEGTASGNLPLSGGGTVVGTNNMPVRLRSGNGNNAYQGYETKAGTFIGALGFNVNGKPSFLNSAQSVESELLHTGNSAKVAIKSTAPTDTSALWVDTANKVTKAYIDGAWTQVA